MSWTALTLCLILSFILSGAESAILTVNRARVRHQAREAGTWGAATLQRLFEHRDRLLASVLLVNDVAALLVFAITTLELVGHFGPTGYAIAFAVSLPVYVFAFELIPKSLCRRAPYRSLRLFTPILRLIDLTVGWTMRLAAVVPQLISDSSTDEEESGNSRGFDGHEEFRNLTDVIEREGTLGRAESDMIRRVLDFPNIEVGQVMIPLSGVTAVPLDMRTEQIVALARKTDYDQLPVMASDGQMLGLIEVFEILRNPDLGGSAINYLRRIIRTKPDENAVGVFQRLRRNGLKLAAVYSEDDRALGIVSAEDIVHRMINV